MGAKAQGCNNSGIWIFKEHSEWFGSMLIYNFFESKTLRLIKCSVRINWSRFIKLDYKQRSTLFLFLSFFHVKKIFPFLSLLKPYVVLEFISLLWFSCICNFDENWLGTTFPQKLLFFLDFIIFLKFSILNSKWSIVVYKILSRSPLHDLPVSLYK